MRRRLSALLLAATALLALPVGAEPPPDPVCALVPAPGCVPAPPPDLPPLGRGTPSPGCAAPPAGPDGWTEAAPATVVAYDAPYTDAHGKVARPYATVIDPWLPCRLYRVGTAARAFADRDVVQRSTDSGRTWETVFRADGFAATRVYVPAPGTVYVAEAGSGAAVVRSRDAGATWEYANGGIAGEHVRALAFAPGGADVAYAVTLPCGLDPEADADPACRQEGGAVRPHVGRVALWATRDGGTSWARVALPDPDAERSTFVVSAVSEREVFVYDRLDGALLAEQWAHVHASGDGGATFRSARTQVQANDGEFFGVAGPRLYAYNRAVFDWVVSDDSGTTWTAVARHYKAEGPPLVPGPAGRVLGFYVFGFGNAAGSQGRAVWSDDGFATERMSAAPAPLTTPDYEYDLAASQVDARGSFYVTVAVRCQGVSSWQGRTRRCGGSEPHAYRWHLLRYDPPPGGVGVAKADDPARPPAGCLPGTGCDIVPLGAGCALDGAGEGAGLAFDGASLLYPAPAGSAAPLRRADPRTCAQREPVTLRLDPGDLVRAREMTRRTHKPDYRTEPPGTPTLPEAPAVDALAVDLEGGRLFFSLRDNGDGATGQGNPASVWTAPLRGGTARLAFVSGRCLPHQDGDGSGMELLAYDRGSATLLACADARPAPLTPGGAERGHRCYQLAPFRGYGYGWAVTGWTALDGGRALLLVETGSGATLVPYDLAACAAEPGYGAAPVAEAKGGGDAAAQLACDPVTFGRVALWHRVGGRAVPYGLPGDAGCRVPTTLRTAESCAVLAVAGTGVAVAGEPVTVAGEQVTTDERGRACPGTVTAGAAARYAGSAAYLPSAAVFAAPVPRLRHPDPGPAVVPPPPVAPAPAPAVPAPVAVAVPPAVVAPQPAAGAPPPPPPPGIQAGVPVERRAQAGQLAIAEQDAQEAVPETDGDPPPEGVLLMAALMTAAATAYAVRTRCAPARA